MSTVQPSVLFVCTANLCRSPLAAALLRARLRKTSPDWQNWRIESAGTWAHDGQSVPAGVLKAGARYGLDLSAHRSRTVSAALLARFALILVMEPGHKEALQVEFPQLRSRIHLLSEMAGQKMGVEDPIDGGLEDFVQTASELDDWLGQGMPKIRELAS